MTKKEAHKPANWRFSFPDMLQSFRWFSREKNKLQLMQNIALTRARFERMNKYFLVLCEV